MAPVIVQPFLTAGAELLVGAIQDPVFGPLVAFGPGGVLAELIGSTRLALAPLTDVDADELIASGKAGGSSPAGAAAAGRPCRHRGRAAPARTARRAPSRGGRARSEPVLAEPRRAASQSTRASSRATDRAALLKTW